MKSLKDYSMNLSEAEYHAYPAWSHSLIARYAREGFSSIATIHDPIKPTPAMEFGSLFDSILTRGKETLNEYVVDETVAPPAETAVFDWLLSKGHRESFNEIDMNEICLAMDGCKFYSNLKPETRYAKLEKAAGYYDVRRTGKKVVSNDDWKDAVDMARVFREDKYLSSLFGTKNTKDIEYIYQAQFCVDMTVGDKTVKVKIMPDILVVNHKEKTIQPVDLKTSSQPAYNFKESFLKFRYDLESSVYTDVLGVVISETEEYADYTILPYLFTDISREDKVPVTYVYDPHDESQLNGFSYTIGEKTYTHKTWDVLLGEMVSYEDENAIVPEGIKLDEPNDMLSVISNR